MSLNNLGLAAFYQGDHATARSLFAECLPLSRELGDRFAIEKALEGIALLDGANGRLQRGAQLWGAGDTLRRALGTPRTPNEQAVHERAVAALRAALGDALYEAAWAAGQAMPLVEAIALALETATAS